jgi:probable phosphoglycerate mutase
MRLYFIRHGESDANVKNVFSNRPPGSPLTEKGLAQAKELAARFSNEKVTAIYASTLLRAQQTARALADALGVPVVIDDALREFDVGKYEGQLFDQGGLEACLEIIGAWLHRGERDRKIEGGESFNDMVARLEVFLRGLEKRHSPGEKILLVGHGGLYGVALPELHTNLPPAFTEKHFMENTDFIVSEMNAGKLVCLSWCGIDGPFEG